jgi:hypothetical protein
MFKLNTHNKTIFIYIFSCLVFLQPTTTSWIFITAYLTVFISSWQPCLHLIPWTAFGGKISFLRELRLSMQLFIVLRFTLFKKPARPLRFDLGLTTMFRVASITNAYTEKGEKISSKQSYIMSCQISESNIRVTI